MCLMPLNPMLHLFERPRAQAVADVNLGAPPWPAGWRTLAVLVPTEQVTGFSSELWASARGHGCNPHLAPTSCAVGPGPALGATSILR